MAETAAAAAPAVVEEDAIPAPPPPADNNNDNDNDNGTPTDDGVVEKLLSSRLLQGYLLLELGCPVCATPLVKHDGNANHNTSNNDDDNASGIRPIANIPYCVKCPAHVVTSEAEIGLIHSNSTDDNDDDDNDHDRRGSILVAIPPPTPASCRTNASSGATTTADASHNMDDHDFVEVLTENNSTIPTNESSTLHSNLSQSTTTTTTQTMSKYTEKAAASLASRRSRKSTSRPTAATAAAAAAAAVSAVAAVVDASQQSKNTTSEERRGGITEGTSDDENQIPSSPRIIRDVDSEEVALALKKNKMLLLPPSPLRRAPSIRQDQDDIEVVRQASSTTTNSRNPKNGHEDSATPVIRQTAVRRQTVQPPQPPLPAPPQNQQQSDLLEVEVVTQVTSLLDNLGDLTMEEDENLVYPVVQSRSPAPSVDPVETSRCDDSAAAAAAGNADVVDHDAVVQNRFSFGGGSSGLQQRNTVPGRAWTAGSESSSIPVVPAARDARTTPLAVSTARSSSSASVASKDRGASSPMSMNSLIEAEYRPFWPSYAERRELATKVLAAKMMEGMSLCESQCRRCSMPLMIGEKKVAYCVVCPHLDKSLAKRKVEAEMGAELERRRNAQKARLAAQRAEVEKSIFMQRNLRAKKNKIMTGTVVGVRGLGGGGGESAASASLSTKNSRSVRVRTSSSTLLRSPLVQSREMSPVVLPVVSACDVQLSVDDSPRSAPPIVTAYSASQSSMPSISAVSSSRNNEQQDRCSTPAAAILPRAASRGSSVSVTTTTPTASQDGKASVDRYHAVVSGSSSRSTSVSIADASSRSRTALEYTHTGTGLSSPVSAATPSAFMAPAATRNINTGSVVSTEDDAKSSAMVPKAPLSTSSNAALYAESSDALPSMGTTTNLAEESSSQRAGTGSRVSSRSNSSKSRTQSLASKAAASLARSRRSVSRATASNVVQNLVNKTEPPEQEGKDVPCGTTAQEEDKVTDGGENSKETPSLVSNKLVQASALAAACTPIVKVVSQAVAGNNDGKEDNAEQADSAVARAVDSTSIQRENQSTPVEQNPEKCGAANAETESAEIDGQENPVATESDAKESGDDAVVVASSNSISSASKTSTTSAKSKLSNSARSRASSLAASRKSTRRRSLAVASKVGATADSNEPTTDEAKADVNQKANIEASTHSRAVSEVAASTQNSVQEEAVNSNGTDTVKDEGVKETSTRSERSRAQDEVPVPVPLIPGEDEVDPILQIAGGENYRSRAFTVESLESAAAESAVSCAVHSEDKLSHNLPNDVTPTAEETSSVAHNSTSQGSQVEAHVDNEKIGMAENYKDGSTECAAKVQTEGETTDTQPVKEESPSVEDQQTSATSSGMVDNSGKLENAQRGENVDEPKSLVNQDSSVYMWNPLTFLLNPASIIPPSPLQRLEMEQEEAKLLKAIQEAEHAKQRSIQLTKASTEQLLQEEIVVAQAKSSAHVSDDALSKSEAAQEPVTTEGPAVASAPLSNLSHGEETITKKSSDKPQTSNEQQNTDNTLEDQQPPSSPTTERVLANQLLRRQAEIDEAEKAREEAELMAQRIADEKRVAEEAKLLADLEEEASLKKIEADKASGIARDAQEKVNAVQRKIIAKTIAEAEASVIAEAESIVRSEAEDYQGLDQKPSKEEERLQQWETLRTEAKSVRARRMLSGWITITDLCQGSQCESSPLISDGIGKICVVCGGNGSGLDGAYDRCVDEVIEGDDTPAEQLQSSSVSNSSTQLENHAPPSLLSYPIDIRHTFSDKDEMDAQISTYDDLHKDFEAKRDFVSKEIGKRMMKGWSLLDLSCPKCVMPLLADPDGISQVCVLCEEIKPTCIEESEHNEKEPNSSKTSSSSHVNLGAEARAVESIDHDEENKQEKNIFPIEMTAQDHDIPQSIDVSTEIDVDTPALELVECDESGGVDRRPAPIQTQRNESDSISDLASTIAASAKSARNRSVGKEPMSSKSGVAQCILAGYRTFQRSEASRSDPPAVQSGSLGRHAEDVEGKHASLLQMIASGDSETCSPTSPINLEATEVDVKGNKSFDSNGSQHDGNSQEDSVIDDVPRQDETSVPVLEDKLPIVSQSPQADEGDEVDDNSRQVESVVDPSPRMMPQSDDEAEKSKVETDLKSSPRSEEVTNSDQPELMSSSCSSIETGNGSHSKVDASPMRMQPFRNFSGEGAPSTITQVDPSPRMVPSFSANKTRNSSMIDPSPRKISTSRSVGNIFSRKVDASPTNIVKAYSDGCKNKSGIGASPRQLTSAAGMDASQAGHASVSTEPVQSTVKSGQKTNQIDASPGQVLTIATSGNLHVDARQGVDVSPQRAKPMVPRTATTKKVDASPRQMISSVSESSHTNESRSVRKIPRDPSEVLPNSSTVTNGTQPPKTISLASSQSRRSATGSARSTTSSRRTMLRPDPEVNQDNQQTTSSPGIALRPDPEINQEDQKTAPSPESTLQARSTSSMKGSEIQGESPRMTIYDSFGNDIEVAVVPGGSTTCDTETQPEREVIDLVIPETRQGASRSRSKRQPRREEVANDEKATKMMTIKVPTNFDVSDEESLRDLIAMARAVSKTPSHKQPGGSSHALHLPSPGLSSADMPYFSSPGNYQNNVPSSKSMRSNNSAPIRSQKIGEHMSVRSSYSARPRITPETPRLPRKTTGSIQQANKSTRSTPQKKDVIVYGGPLDVPEFTMPDDCSHTSINSEAIDALLDRIDETKHLLEQPSSESDDVENHNRLSQLLANLAAAAEAMQRFDELEAIDRVDSMDSEACNYPENAAACDE